MEGVVDHPMRAILTKVGGFDACVTEFVRVVDRLHPKGVFLRYCPELSTEGKTFTGTPVIIQLLGGDASVVAINARRAAQLGAPGIDINFGCPSRFVNRKSGGAILLKEPQRLYQIVQATRQAVPDHIPVSAKIRLGYDNTNLALENAHAVEEGGANFITVHARTKVDGYKAPARWTWLRDINDALAIPVVANGDIMSLQDYQQCYEISGCEHIMIGRGAIRQPDLALQIKSNTLPYTWDQIRPLLHQLHYHLTQSSEYSQIKTIGRIKQWVGHLKISHEEAKDLFDKIRTLKTLNELEQTL